MGKNLIHIQDLTKLQVFEIFQLADIFLAEKYLGQPLQGKTIVLIFPENSTRTKLTFEKGIQMLGGNAVQFSSAALDKKEDVKDVIGYMESWADAVVVRHDNLALIERMAENSHIPVINAMTSKNHPCEIIADLYSLSKIRKDFLKDSYLFLGTNGNVGESWRAAAQLMGFQLEQCCPLGYELNNIRVYRDLNQAMAGKDVICTDSIPAAAREDFKGYQIGIPQMRMANEGAILNPCPPFHRGEEVSADVIDSQYFVGYSFKKTLLVVWQAILYYLLKQKA